MDPPDTYSSDSSLFSSSSGLTGGSIFDFSFSSHSSSSIVPIVLLVPSACLSSSTSYAPFDSFFSFTCLLTSPSSQLIDIPVSILNLGFCRRFILKQNFFKFSLLTPVFAGMIFVTDSGTRTKEVSKPIAEL